MFSQLNFAGSNRRRKIFAATLGFHGLVLGWLLHAPEPPLLTANSIAIGHNGKLVTQIYFPSPNPDDSATSSPAHATEVYRRRRLGHEKMIFKQNAALAKLTLPPKQLAPSSAQDKADVATLSSLGHGAPAGLPYGSVPGGPVYGNEIRPALPISTLDPVVYPWELPDAEGNVVVEITIDARGEIVDKTILHSMGDKLDQRFLAALNSWHFHPATRNGVAIASKQDAIFHYRARG